MLLLPQIYFVAIEHCDSLQYGIVLQHFLFVDLLVCKGKENSMSRDVKS